MYFFIECSVVVWNVETKEAICGSQAAMSSAGQVFTIAFCNYTDDIFVTGGEYVYNLSHMQAV